MFFELRHSKNSLNRRNLSKFLTSAFYSCHEKCFWNNACERSKNSSTCSVGEHSEDKLAITVLDEVDTLETIFKSHTDGEEAD
jgi:hypothetical protein